VRNEEGKPGYAGGMLTTAGNLVFYATQGGEFRAVNASTGEILYSLSTGTAAKSGPITYQQNGKQYVVQVLGGTAGFGRDEAWEQRVRQRRHRVHALKLRGSPCIADQRGTVRCRTPAFEKTHSGEESIMQVALLIAAAAIASALIAPGFVSADEVPPVNPMSGDAKMIREGKSWFVNVCSPCHGGKGGRRRRARHGGGPAQVEQRISQVRRDRQGRQGHRTRDDRCRRGAACLDEKVIFQIGAVRRDAGARRGELERGRCSAVACCYTATIATPNARAQRTQRTRNLLDRLRRSITRDASAC
jgi:cytochrome c5